jgi:Ca2+-binding EF-hand superfamily protein
MENNIMKDLLRAIGLSLLVIIALGIITKLMFADEMAGKRIPPFIAYDVNQDNYVSKNEFHRVNAKRAAENDTKGMPLMHDSNGPDFREYDTDLDGKLDEIEFLRSCRHCHESR